MWRALSAIALLCSLPGLAQEVVRGPVTIYDTVYERVDEGPPFVEAPRQEENWRPPAPTPAERAAGFMTFTRPEPFDIKPWSKPKPAERVTELHCRAALGESTAICFAVHALERLNGLQVSVSDNRQPLGIEVRYAHFWAQRTDWRGRTYYVTPELLLAMRNGQAQFPAKGGTLQWRPLSIPNGESRLFWVRLKVAAEAKPGEYVRTLTVRAQGKQPLNLRLRVHVYPFRLQKPPDKRWLLYSDSGRLSNLSDDKLAALLRHLSEWGIDGLTELPFGNLDLNGIAEGRVGYDPQPLLRWHRLMREAGLRGPHTIGTFIEEEVARRMGIQRDLNQPWDETLRRAMQTISRTVVQTLQPHGIEWLFYGWDEPGPENIRALEQYRAWREGGAQTYVTFFVQGTYDAAGQWMTHPCFSVGLVANEQLSEQAYQRCRTNNQKFYWYGSGCYLGQEGRLFPNRYLAGWLFWKSKADGQVSWTFVRPFEDPFNDFDGSDHNSVEPKDQCTVYPEYAQPGDAGSIRGIIPTIQWEALREGISDYLYLHTLRNTIAYGRSVAVNARSGRWKQAILQTAQQGEDTLRAVERSVPWLYETGRAGFTNANLQEIRIIIGLTTERLVRLLKGELPPTPRRASALNLQVRLVPPASHPVSSAYLPVVTLPRWDQPPQIDGRLGEPQWQNAVIASSFTESNSAVPIPETLHTQAMLAIDNEALYLGFSCRAPYPERLAVERRQRDAPGLWLDEGVEIFLASPDAPERYAHFIVNAGGFVYDELGFDQSWNTSIQVATQIRNDGWMAEIAIPWQSLPFAVNLSERGKPLLRLNLGRNHQARGGTLSHWAWSPTFGWFHNPARFGIAMIAPDDIVVKQITLPAYADDPPVQVTLVNRGPRRTAAQVLGEEVILAPQQQRTVTVPSSTAPGEHRVDLSIRWQKEGLQLPVVYSIPAPVQVLRQAVLVRGDVVEVPISLALRKPTGHPLNITVSGAQPAEASAETGRDFSLSLREVQGDRLRLRFALPAFRAQTPDVLIVIPPQ